MLWYVCTFIFWYLLYLVAASANIIYRWNHLFLSGRETAWLGFSSWPEQPNFPSASNSEAPYEARVFTIARGGKKIRALII